MNDMFTEIMLADPDPAFWKIVTFTIWLLLTAFVLLHWGYRTYYFNPKQVREVIQIKLDRILEDLDQKSADLEEEHRSKRREAAVRMLGRGMSESGHILTEFSDILVGTAREWEDAIKDGRRKADDVLLSRGYGALRVSPRFEEYDTKFNYRTEMLRGFVKGGVKTMQEDSNNRGLTIVVEAPSQLKKWMDK